MFTLFLIACGGGTTEFKGTQMESYFPLDGDRQAVYGSDEAANGFDLVVTKLEPAETIDGAEVVTLEHSEEDAGVVLGAVKWSNSDGVKIYGYRSDATSDFTMFDTPIVFAEQFMRKGDEMVTETNDMTFTSSFVAVEDCPVLWGPDWKECVHMRLDDGDGDDSVGPLFAGDYWLVTRYGPAWMQTTGVAAKWNLKDYQWSGEEG